MAINSLSSQRSVNLFFRQVLANLEYWLKYVANKKEDLTALTQKRTLIVTSINFALDGYSRSRETIYADKFELILPSIYKLIELFSSYMEKGGHWQEWHLILKQAIKVADGCGDKANVVLLSVRMAKLLQRQSQIKASIYCYRQGIHLARQVGDKYNEARAYTNMGYMYTELGYWQRAKIVCCYALAIFEQIENDYGIAHTENHLGLLYTRQRCWEKAQQHLEHACEIWQTMNDVHGLMHGFINLGLLCNEMEIPVKALPYLKKAVYYAELAGEEDEVGMIYNNIGIAYMSNNELEQAEASLWQAETIFNQLSNLPGLAQTWGSLGKLYTKQEKWQEANQQLNSSLKTWRDLNNKYGEIQALKNMIMYELARGNQQKVDKLQKEVDYLINQHNRNI